jgi:hypothetical protein
VYVQSNGDVCCLPNNSKFLVRSQQSGVPAAFLSLSAGFGLRDKEGAQMSYVMNTQ